ncbi:CotS family spore coat protein [Lachnospiraceae bacterium ZAX-1]
MYNRVNQILEQYPFAVKQTYKGRGALICDTDMGLKIVKEYKGSKERADFLDKTLQFVRENGQERIDCIVKTKEGLTLAKDTDAVVYMVRDWYEGHECDTKNRDDVLKSINKLAKLHNILRHFEEEIPEFLQIKPDTLLLEYERHSRELKKVRNYICAKKKKTDFEIEFAKNYHTFYEQAEGVATLQKKALNQMQNNQNGGRHLYGICHGDFNQHNILFSKGGIAILNFEKALYDVLVSDLSNFIRKILEKHNWNLGLGMDMLNTYSNVRPLEEEEIRQLYIRLAYPEKFWKISNHYYNSSKAWVCGRNLEKLSKVVQQNESRGQFLNFMSHNILF